MSYTKRLLAIALPIIAQNFFSAALNLVSGLMIGQLGETAVAAVGLSNQSFFLLTLLLFGASSGMGLFVAQLWGKGDTANIRRVIGLGMTVSLTGALIFFVIAVIFPGWFLSIYTTDPAVIAEGVPFLRIIGWGFFFLAVTYVLSAGMRSTGDVRTPMFVSLGALIVSILLGYLLVFGHLGLPQMGIRGAALAGLVARVLECLGLVLAVTLRHSPIVGTLREMFSFDWPFARAVLSRALPVTFNELLWALGITTYNAIYAHIGTEAIAAINIAGTIEQLAFVAFFGISDATAILVGHGIGGGNEGNAYHDARRSLFLAMAGAAIMGLILYLLSGSILNLYNVSEGVKDYTRRILIVIASCLWLRVSNMILFVGIFRSGGDTRFAFILDALTVWLVGVPSAFAGAFLLNLPVYWVYLMIMSEEALKWIVAMFRFFSKRWIHNVTHTVMSEA